MWILMILWYCDISCDIAIFNTLGPFGPHALNAISHEKWARLYNCRSSLDMRRIGWNYVPWIDWILRSLIGRRWLVAAPYKRRGSRSPPTWQKEDTDIYCYNRVRAKPGTTSTFCSSQRQVQSAKVVKHASYSQKLQYGWLSLNPNYVIHFCFFYYSTSSKNSKF